MKVESDNPIPIYIEKIDYKLTVKDSNVEILKYSTSSFRYPCLVTTYPLSSNLP